MKKTLLFLFTFMLALVNVFAQETTLTWTAGEWNGLTLTKDGYTITLDKAQASTAPKVNGDGEIRVYAKGTVTVSSESQDIKKITFVLTKQGKLRLPELTAEPAGTMAYDKEAGKATWTGDAKSISFTVGDKAVNGSTPTKAGQLCFNSIVISSEGGTVEPTPQPEPEPQPQPELGTVFSENFSADLGAFTIENTNIGTLEYVWNWAGTKYQCAKASAFADKKANASESWLISPVIDLSKSTESVLNFEEAANFFKTAEAFKAACSVKVRIGEGKWEDLNVNSIVAGTSWDFSPASASLQAYDGKKIQLAFRYTSTEELAGTWEIKNVLVQGKLSEAPVVVNTPTFTPEAGTYTDEVEVSLTADEGLKIYYTLNGELPTASSTLYNAPFKLTETTTVRAIAVNADNVSSEDVLAVYTIKTSPKAPENGALYNFNENKWNLQVSDSENSYEILGPITEGHVTLSFTSGSTPTRMWNDFNNGLQLRIYKGGSMTFAVPEGMKIVKITFDASKFETTADCGTLEGYVWNGSSEKVVFSANKTTNINYAIVECEGNITGINGVEADQEVEKVVYSIDGRRLQAPVKGLNIINGQKVLVK